MDELADIEKSLDDDQMHYSILILGQYLSMLKLFRALNNTKKEIIPDYEGLIKLTSDCLEDVRGAFISREYLNEVFEFDISDKRIGELEAFLNGTKNKISDLDEEIDKLEGIYHSLKYPN